MLHSRFLVLLVVLERGMQSEKDFRAGFEQRLGLRLVHLRHIVAQVADVTERRVREQEPRIREIVASLIDAVCEQGECDLVWDVAAWVPLIVIADALGFDEADRPTLLEWSDDMMRMLGTRDPEAEAKGHAAAAAYYEHVSRLVEARHASPTDDLLGVLVQAEVDGAQMSDHEVVMEALLILIGGDETTRHVITGGAYQVLAEPSRWAALREDPSLLPRRNCRSAYT